jgi:hypothetical protein
VIGTLGWQKNWDGSSGRATGDLGVAMNLRPRFLKHCMRVAFWIIGVVVQILWARNARS